MSTADGDLDEDAVWGAGSEGAASEPEEEAAAGLEARGGLGAGGAPAGGRPAPAGGEVGGGRSEGSGGDAPGRGSGGKGNGEGGGLSRELGWGAALGEGEAISLEQVPSPARRRANTEAGGRPPVLNVAAGGFPAVESRASNAPAPVPERNGGEKAALTSLGAMKIPAGKRPRAHTDSMLGRLGTSAPINIPSAQSELQRKLLQETQPRAEQKLLAQSFVPPHLVGDHLGMETVTDFGSTPMKADMLKRRNMLMKKTGFLRD